MIRTMIALGMAALMLTGYAEDKVKSELSTTYTGRMSLPTASIEMFL